MATDRWQQVKELLQQAFVLDPEKRAAFLAEAFAKDEYRAAVRRKFARRPSYDPAAKYDPRTINALIYPSAKAPQH